MPASDLISIDCPHCKKRLRGKATMAGKRIRCPNPSCGQTIAVPADAPAASVPAPAARPVWPWVVGGLGCLALGGLGLGLLIVLVSAVLMTRDTDPPIAQAPITKQNQGLTTPPIVPPATDKKTGGGTETKTPPIVPPATDKKTGGGTEVKVPPVTPPTGDEKLIFRLPIDAVASQERLDKLKVIRLDAKVRFAVAKNVNDITLMWCWEPNIMVRFEEKFQQANLDNIFKLARGSGLGEEAFVRKIISKLKEQMKLDDATARRYDAEVEDILRRRDYKTLFDAVLLIDTNDAHAIFNKRLALRQPPEQAAKMRNLCYALSLSNLVPLKKHAFTIEAGPDVDVRGKPSRQFRVRDSQGTQLELYFDKSNDLLAKITTPNGHDPRAIGLVSRTARWDHYFSDYREADGIKQWRQLECHVNGSPYATLSVERVQYFDRLLPELQLPKSGTVGGSVESPPAGTGLPGIPAGKGSTVATTPTTPGKLIFPLPLDAIASEQRLEKLKVVRLVGKASFSASKNVNDITLAWCWDPTITVRFIEKRNGKLGPSVLMNTDEAYYVPEVGAPTRYSADQAYKVRNLCYALSLSTIVPLRRHAFTIESNADVTIRGERCRQFKVRDQRGALLELYFDKRSNLLTKITHQGHDPARGLAATVRWERFFSDYREVDGIKQWHCVEGHCDGRHHHTYRVTSVQYFDRLLPELQLPKSGG